MNEVNIGEVYYLRAKRASVEKAEQFLRQLERLPIQPVSNSFSEVLEAARIKSRFPISYGDAFAVATAIRENATIVTGDPEFESVAELVPIDWLKT
jgi:ribonuclease VapC